MENLVFSKPAILGLYVKMWVTLHEYYTKRTFPYVPYTVNQSIVWLCIPSKSAIRTFYSLGARLPSSCADLPKCTRNLMAHDPFNARGADVNSRKRKRGTKGAKNLGEIIRRMVAPNPDPGNKYDPAKESSEKSRDLSCSPPVKITLAFITTINSSISFKINRDSHDDRTNLNLSSTEGLTLIIPPGWIFFLGTALAARERRVRLFRVFILYAQRGS